VNQQGRYDYDNMHYIYEIECNGKVIRNGQRVKFKNDWRCYTFHRVEHNHVTDQTWVVCFSPDGTMYTFHASKLIGQVVKRSQRKK
jgi:hypothetical protein